MKFKIGDRVKIISVKDTGTVIDAGEEMSIVQLDNPEKIVPIEMKETLKERGYETPKVAKYHTFNDDLEHISSSGNPEKDWKDIWDSNT